MKLRFFSIILVLFLLVNFVSAQDYGIYQHNIDIIIGNDGTAEITERFNLFFNTDESKIEFREKSLILGSDLRLWEDFDEQFSPSIGLNNIINGKITYSESENYYLEIKYNLSDALMTKGKETSFIEEYSIKATYLNKLFQSGLWIIPDNTKINIELPPGAEINESISPDATLSSMSTKRIITWDGYKSANQLKVKYVLWKKINPIIDLNQLTDFLFRTSEGLIIIGIIILIIGVIIWKRKYFSSKIESFVENNTVFEEDD